VCECESECAREVLARVTNHTCWRVADLLGRCRVIRLTHWMRRWVDDDMGVGMGGLVGWLVG